MKLKVVELFGSIAGIIRLLILGLIFFFCFQLLIKVGKIFDLSIPRQDYQTVFRKDTLIVSPPDTVVRWLERITQVPMKPETIYQYVEYSYIPTIMVNQINSDGKHINIFTQECQTTHGQKLSYPWVKKWQFVPPQNFIAYKEYFHWDKLIVSYTYPYNTIKGKSTLYILSDKLSISPFLKVDLDDPQTKWGIEGSIKLW